MSYLINISLRVTLVLFNHMFLRGWRLHKWLKIWLFHHLYMMKSTHHSIIQARSFLTSLASFVLSSINSPFKKNGLDSDLIYHVYKPLSWNRARESKMAEMTRWGKVWLLWTAAFVPVSLISLWDYEVILHVEDAFKYFGKQL